MCSHRVEEEHRSCDDESGLVAVILVVDVELLSCVCCHRGALTAATVTAATAATTAFTPAAAKIHADHACKE
ncbi:hypothetical protein V501_06677 [Pseudogymnoascus sp. VKM F-4519 (FW-2642)]|nr:hypothetical protein V501_06677 [Pseudogymnoascus sp. VKM F-4519 (FW-2642)]